MSYRNDVMGAALDRHITGNYGMDQFMGEDAFEALCESTCAPCFMQVLGQCDLIPDDNCLVIQAAVKREEEIQAADDDAMYEKYLEDQLEREEDRIQRDSAEIDHDDPINQG
jgi:hypothetical protein